MITLTRFNKSQFVINCDWIEMVEGNPDSVITLTNGHKYVVSETVDEIISKVIQYKQSVGCQVRMPFPASENGGL